jgi:uncharacterized repeat protein (TIGR02543 family)
MPAGTYDSKIVPARGTAQTTILYGTSVVMVNFSLRSLILLQNATPLLEVIFTASAAVTFAASPSAGASIELLGPSGAPQLVRGGTTLTIPAGTYEAIAVPSSGYTFVGWTTSNSSNLAISTTISVATVLTVAGGGTLTAGVVKVSHNLRVGFLATPRVGAIQFNAENRYTSGMTNASVGGGQYLVSALPNPGWTFVMWLGTGHITIATSSTAPTAIIVVTGTGSLTAVFHRTMVAVTFVAYNPHGSGASPATLTIAGRHLHSGDTLYVALGAHAILLTSSTPLGRWSVSPGLSVGSGASTTLTVTGSGTLYAIL